MSKLVVNRAQGLTLNLFLENLTIDEPLRL